MTEYLNLNGNSGITGYGFDIDYIDIEFNSGSVYRYTRASVGSENLAIMKALAKSGAGLNAFINKNVRLKYAHRFGTSEPVNLTVTPNNAVAVVKELVKSGKPINISVG